MYTNLSFACFFSLLLLHACSSKKVLSTSAVEPLINYEHPITYAPEQYVCARM